MERKEARADQAQNMGDQITMNILTGKLPPRILNTQVGQDFLRSHGLDKHPGIQAALTEAQANELASGEPTQLEAPPAPGAEPGGVGGPMINIPKPMPTLESVQETIRKEEEAKALEVTNKEREITLKNQLLIRQWDETMRKNRMMSIDEQVRQFQALKEQLDIPEGQVSVSLDEEGNLRVSASVDPAAMEARAESRSNRKINNEIRYENYISQTGVQKTAHAMRLRSVLERDVALEDLAMDEGVSAPVAKALGDAISQINKSTSKDKVVERAEAVDTLLKSVNSDIDQYNKRNAVAAKGLGLGKDEIESRKVAPLRFEDVSGGISKVDWLKRRQPAKAEKLTSDIRNESRGASIPGQPSAASAKSDSAKVKEVYDGLKEIVLGAVAKRPDLTSEEIRASIVGNKDALMAEYGLNERLFSLVTAMADRVLG
jgi:chaperonin cofactor prefoldin